MSVHADFHHLANFFAAYAHLGIVSNLHPSRRILITQPIFGDLYPFKGSGVLALSVTYIRLDGILLLSLFFFFFFDLHPLKGYCHLASSVTYIHLGEILLLSQFFVTYTH